MTSSRMSIIIIIKKLFLCMRLFSNIVLLQSLELFLVRVKGNALVLLLLLIKSLGVSSTLVLVHNRISLRILVEIVLVMSLGGLFQDFLNN